MVSRLKRVRFGPVFLNSDLPMGRWREMATSTKSTSSAPVSLTPVAMPQMNARAKTSSSVCSVNRRALWPATERVARTLRPALNAPATGGRISREPQIEKASAARQARRARKASVHHAHRARQAVVKHLLVVAVIAVRPVAVRHQFVRPTAPTPNAQPSQRRKSATWPETGRRRAVGQAPWRLLRVPVSVQALVAKPQ